MLPSHPFLTRLSLNLTRLSATRQGMLLAISGGADSMSLLHGMQNLLQDSAGQRIEVAHLNHGLRGADSDADADFVWETCKTASIPCTIETLPPGVLASKSRGSLENAARTARYDFLERTAKQKTLPLIVTAHHQQDQAETILFSLLRGTGLRGLRGVPESRCLPSGILLIRPMLTIERAVVRDYLQTRQVAYREDSTNASVNFARNRIRILLQLLNAADLANNPRPGELESSLLKLGQQAADTIVAIDRLSGKILLECVLECSPASLVFDRTRLKTWPEPLIRHALILQWSRQEWPRGQMSSAQWQRLSEAVFTGAPRRWTFPSEITMTVSRDRMTLRK